MTTESKQTPPRGLARGVSGLLLRSGAVVLGLVLVLAAVAAATTGRAGLAGALLGGLVVLVVLLGGSLLVDAVATIAPALSLVFALSTYLVQLMALALLFVALQRAGVLGTSVHAGWLGGAMVAVVVVWLAVQVVLTVRARIPVYDLDAGHGVEAAVSKAPTAGAR